MSSILRSNLLDDEKIDKLNKINLYKANIARDTIIGTKSNRIIKYFIKRGMDPSKFIDENNEEIMQYIIVECELNIKYFTGSVELLKLYKKFNPAIPTYVDIDRMKIECVKYLCDELGYIIDNCMIIADAKNDDLMSYLLDHTTVNSDRLMQLAIIKGFRKTICKLIKNGVELTTDNKRGLLHICDLEFFNKYDINPAKLMTSFHSFHCLSKPLLRIIEFYKNYKGFKLHEFISTALDYDYSLQSVEDLMTFIIKNNITLDEDNLMSLNSLPDKYKKFIIMYEDHCSKVIQEKTKQLQNYLLLDLIKIIMEY
jgi:hypothetical protein